jgi:hypothetical protein
MSYSYQRLTPGRKPSIKLTTLIKNIGLCKNCTFYQDCQCIQENVAQIKTGYNNPTQTEANRISQAITGTLGGRTTFGNFGLPANLTYLGGIEGQPGGSPRPLRNKF